MGGSMKALAWVGAAACAFLWVWWFYHMVYLRTKRFRDLGALEPGAILLLVSYTGWLYLVPDLAYRVATGHSFWGTLIGWLTRR
jgi:hypothetical protein